MFPVRLVQAADQFSGFQLSCLSEIPFRKLFLGREDVAYPGMAEWRD
jgi:hypothetical protein